MDDGYGALVERLWPRGVPKTDAEIDEWAQSSRLRALRRRAPAGRLTLVHSARGEGTDAVVVPIERLRRGGRS